ncbi:fibronectin type III domain-containing protein [Muricauda sp. NFXS6]|uniref:fibronectin type III domain-containing protein n=1 Tax=Allomuricauda sp. NFXS6 TaxID=2819094 RepID=UPI0032DE9B01
MKNYQSLMNVILNIVKNLLWCPTKHLSLFNRLFIVYCLLSTVLATAQIYPVQATPQMVPPYSFKLSDYTTTTQEKLFLNLLLTDAQESGRQVRLKLFVEGPGINFQSADFVNGALPIVLDGGINQRLTNLDLQAYFNLNNLVGITPKQYSEQLPEGQYQFCFEVYDQFSGQRISNRSCANIYLVLNDPPLLNVPFRSDLVTAQEPQNIIFNWTPRHINAPAVQYEFTLKELWDTGMDPQAAFLTSPHLYQTTTYATTLHYGLAQTPLLEGKTYGWRVRAFVSDGINTTSLFRNNGLSEIYHFAYRADCKPPSFVLSEAENSQTVKINWQMGEHLRYRVQYRKKGYGEDDWFGLWSQTNVATIRNLEAGTVYEFRVGGDCNPLSVSPGGGEESGVGLAFSPIHEFTTPTEDEMAYYNCGIPPEVEITNQDPLQQLEPYEVFTAGDFPIVVREASGSKGYFSGWGYITLPFLEQFKEVIDVANIATEGEVNIGKFSRIRVEFDNIKINTDYQLVEGMVETSYDPNWSGIVDVDQAIADVGDFVNEIYETLEEALAALGITNGNYEEENVNFEIADITVNEEGETIVAGKNGEEQNLGAGNNTVVPDANGTTIVVNDEGKVAAVKNSDVVEEAKDTPYYVMVDGRTQQFKYNDKLYFVRQRKPATLYLKTSIDSLGFASPIWKMGDEVVGEGDTISIDLKQLVNENLNIEDGEDGSKSFKVKLEVYEKPITRFDLTVSNRNNFDGSFLFDDTETGNNTSKLVLENSGDYEEISDDLFHQDYSLDKKEKYFVPVLGTKLNQTIQLKVKLSHLNNSDSDFKVTLKPTNKNIIVGTYPTLDISSNNTTIDIQVIKKHIDENIKHYIEVLDQSNELVGKIEIVCKSPSPKEIRFVYIEDENGLQSILKESDILNKLNNSSHNQLFKEWSHESSVSIALDTLAKYSLQRPSFNITNPTIQQIINERNRIRTDNLQMFLAYAYYKNLDIKTRRDKFTIMFLSSEFNGTNSGTVISKVNGSNIFSYHSTILYSTANMQTVAHEQGHDLGLPHVFDGSSGKRKMPKYSASNNFMDYTNGTDNRNMFFQYQMKISQ